MGFTYHRSVLSEIRPLHLQILPLALLSKDGEYNKADLCLLIADSFLRIFVLILPLRYTKFVSLTIGAKRAG